MTSSFPHDENAPADNDVAPLRKDYDALQRIIDVLGHVTEKDTVDDVCRAIVEGVRETLGFDRVGLFLWEEDTRCFRGTFGTGLEGQTTEEHDLFWEVSEWPGRDRLAAGDVLFEGELDQPRQLPGEEGVKPCLVVLRFGDTVYGIISVDNRITRRPIDLRELKHLTLFSRIVGNAVELSRARQELSENELRFRQISENSREVIWELDSSGRYTFASFMVKEILGIEPEQMVGQPYTAFVTVDDREKMLKAVEQTLRDKSPLQPLINRHVHADGHVVVLESTGLPLFDADGELVGFRGAHRDVSVQMDLAEELRQSQKLEAIGRLAGGVAHYFNNLLTLILGCSSLLLETLEEDNPIREELDAIHDAGEQAASLSQQLLAFSRKQILRVNRVNVNSLFEMVNTLLMKTLGDDVELVLHLAPDVGEVEADPEHLKHIILQLCINARAAITDALDKAKGSDAHRVAGSASAKPGRSELIIETANVELDESACRNIPHLSPGLFVLLSIRDTGVGMPEEVREHIFEPFFTTDDVGGGVGLGLASVYGTITQMGGDIRVESSQGEGTTFRIYLPAEKKPESEHMEETIKEPEKEAGELILVVEDEPAVLHVTIKMLEGRGYRTLSADNGADALQICQERKDEIDVILTDMMMPNMTGKQLIQELNKLAGDFKVVFLSGYSSADTVDGERLGEDIPFLQKPFTRAQLIDKIREVLDA